MKEKLSPEALRQLRQRNAAQARLIRSTCMGGKKASPAKRDRLKLGVACSQGFSSYKKNGETFHI